MGELRFLAERRELSASPFMSSGAPAPGTAGSVLLLQGFGVPARTLAPLGAWLARGGWDVSFAPVGWNVGCGEATVDVVVERLEQLAGRSGPAVVLGHSRGGLLGRVAAVRHPRLVAGLVTVCTPWALGPPARPGVTTMSRLVRLARRHGLRTMGSIDCDHAACCTAFRADMGVVPTVPWAALWSSRDTVGGAASVPPTGPTRTVDLGTSHLGAVRSVAGWTAIGDALQHLGLTSTG
jgi:pimeloyl-ACP methyl ester carboxylesterase